jgi:hypothetical protein
MQFNKSAGVCVSGFIILGMGKATRTRGPKRRQTAKLLPDAFLEAVLDAGGDEATVLETLEVRARELHDWLAKNPDVIDLARLALEEREIDTDEPEFGWLRPTGSLEFESEDANWSQYRGLLQQEIKLEAGDTLQDSLERTQAMVAELQAKKRARLEQYQPQTQREESD